MRRVHLLSTDFDGTLIGFESHRSCGEALAGILAEHRSHGGLWALNTGRTLPHALEGIAHFQAPVSPDFLLTNEREIFRRSREGEWEDHGSWNALCTARHQEFFRETLPLLEEIEGMLATFGGAIPLYGEADHLEGLVARDEGQIEEICGRLQEMTRHVPDFSFQRNKLFLRFCHIAYDKGSALAELCRLEGIARENVLCAGDHFNDLPMLDTVRAAMLVCPSNAIDPVKEAVLAGGGHVASQPFSDGVAEGIRSHAFNR